MKPSYNQAAACLFCEDIRFEANGQISIIGIFPARIGINEFPTVLTKFTIYSMVRCDINKPPQSISLKLSYPWADEPVSGDGPPQEWIMAELDRARDNNDTALFLTMHMPLDNFEVKSPGKIRASILMDGKEYKAGSLNFKERVKDEKKNQTKRRVLLK